MPDGAPVDRRPTAPLVNLPNIVSFGRLCAVPPASWLVLAHRIGEAFVLFVAADSSDALDGCLARRYGGNAIGALPDRLAILVVFRDLPSVGVLWFSRC